MVMLTRLQLGRFRAQRQRLAVGTQGCTPEDVFDILRALQPYPPVAESMPGSPPQPVGRVVGYEESWSQRWRAAGRLVKGRFMHGNIAYVADDDLALYGAAFRQPLRRPLSQPAGRILRLLEEQGPLLKSALREMTQIEPSRFDRALLALNQAFEVMEIQRRVDWDSPWDLRRRAYPAADLESWEQVDARLEALRRFGRVFGPATVVQMAYWSGWDRPAVETLVHQLLAGRQMVAVEVEGEPDAAYVMLDALEALGAVAPADPFVVFLPTNDPLVMPHWSLMRRRYRPQRYPHCHGAVVMDGQVVGAAWGHYKRKIIQIEDLSVEPNLLESGRMDQVLATLEAHLSGGAVPVHIYGINGEAEAPWVEPILTRGGYRREAGYYVKSSPRGA